MSGNSDLKTKNWRSMLETRMSGNSDLKTKTWRSMLEIRMSGNIKISGCQEPRARYIQQSSQADDFHVRARILPTSGQMDLGYIDISIKMDVDSNTRLATGARSHINSNIRLATAHES